MITQYFQKANRESIPFAPVNYIKPKEPVYIKPQFKKQRRNNLIDDQADVSGDDEGDDCENEEIVDYNKTEEYEKDSFLASEEDDEEEEEELPPKKRFKSHKKIEVESSDDEEEEIPMSQLLQRNKENLPKIYNEDDSQLSNRLKFLTHDPVPTRKKNPEVDLPLRMIGNPAYGQLSQDSQYLDEEDTLANAVVTADREWYDDTEEENHAHLPTENEFLQEYMDHEDVTIPEKVVDFTLETDTFDAAVELHKIKVDSIFVNHKEQVEIEAQSSDPVRELETLVRISQPVNQRHTLPKTHFKNAQINVFKERRLGPFRII